jgi:hypothetical protein
VRRLLACGFALASALALPSARGALPEPVVGTGGAPAAPSLQAAPTSIAAPGPDTGPATAAATSRGAVDDPRFFARAQLSSTFIWGSKLEGHGSRAHYTGAMGSMDLEVVDVPWKYVGFELALRAGYGAVGKSGGGGGGGSEPNFGRLDVALDGVLVRTPRAALLLGLGLGGDAGDRYWFGGVRGYPFAIVRGRVVIAKDQAIHASWQLVPASLGDRSALQHRAQLDWSYDLLSFGLRFAYARVRGGDPQRDYPDYEAGAALGVAVW